MRSLLFLVSLILFPAELYSQKEAILKLVSDPSMVNGSVSVCILETGSGKSLGDYDAKRSLVPASVMKLFTSAASLELIGTDYKFRTKIGYDGSFDPATGILNGDIIIKGGGDPCLGSGNFESHYGDFLSLWTEKIVKMGVKKITGQVITDDSYFDYEPVPSKWLWEDLGNYYGAGVFGLSIFDNTYSLVLKTSSPGSRPEIATVEPDLAAPEIKNYLQSEGSRDNGYIFGSPYNNKIWISGTVPQNRDSFVLKGSVSDPPLLAARLLTRRLSESGVNVNGTPTTFRNSGAQDGYDFIEVKETISPPLSEIIKILNSESINLYGETLLKQLGLVYKGKGSTASGVEVLYDFLKTSGIGTDGVTLADGSGLSPLSHISAEALSRLLLFMKRESSSFDTFYSSLPAPGEDGTLKNYFKDDLYIGRVRLKTGSMTGVRSFAGYITPVSGKEIAFAVIINYYNGSSDNVIAGIENIVREIILNN